jgi:hypothetical protein
LILTHADPARRRPAATATDPGTQDDTMALAAGFGLFILFLLITLALGDEDAKSTNDSRDDLLVWMHLARH